MFDSGAVELFRSALLVFEQGGPGLQAVKCYWVLVAPRFVR